MSLELPEGLRWLAWVAGTSWPDGDEDAAWADSAAWKAAADELKALLPTIDQAKQATMAAYSDGEAAAAIGARFDGLRSGDQSLEALADMLQTISDSTFDIGTQIQGIKLTVVVSLGVLALEILWAWMFPPTASAVEAAAVSSTRSFLKVTEDIVQKNIAKLAAAMGARTDKRLFWREIATGNIVAPSAKGWGVYGARAVENAALSLGIDGAVQGGQMLDGKRRHFNAAQFGLSGLSAVAGVAPGRELARYMGIGSHKLLGNQLNNLGGRIARGAVIGASAGVTSAVFGNLAVGAVTGDWSSFSSGPGWVGGAARGAVAGGARGGFAKSSPISSSDFRYRFWMHKSGKPRTGDHPEASTGNREGSDGSYSSRGDPATGPASQRSSNTTASQRSSNAPVSHRSPNSPSETSTPPATHRSSGPPPTQQTNLAGTQHGGGNRGGGPGTSWFDDGSSVSNRQGGDGQVVAAPGTQHRGGRPSSTWFDDGSSVSSRSGSEGGVVTGPAPQDRGGQGASWLDNASSVGSRPESEGPTVSGPGSQARGPQGQNATWFDDGSSVSSRRSDDGVVVTGDHPGWRPPTSFESSVDGTVPPSRTPPTAMLTNRPPGPLSANPGVPPSVSPAPSQPPPVASGALPANSGAGSTNATVGSGSSRSTASGPPAGPPARPVSNQHHGHYDEETPFLGAGKDLRAKSRPRIYPHDGQPLPDEFHAGEAPEWGEWLPPGAYPAPEDDSNSGREPNTADSGRDSDDSGAQARAGAEGTVDIPFTLGNR